MQVHEFVSNTHYRFLMEPISRFFVEKEVSRGLCLRSCSTSSMSELELHNARACHSLNCTSVWIVLMNSGSTHHQMWSKISQQGQGDCCHTCCTKTAKPDMQAADSLASLILAIEQSGREVDPKV